MEKKTDISRLRAYIRNYGFAVGSYKFFKKPIKIKLSFIEDVLNAPVDELSLSVRGYNALRRCDVKTIGDVIDLINENRLTNLRNLGIKTSIEIKSKIIDYGFNILSDERKNNIIEDLYHNNI